MLARARAVPRAAGAPARRRLAAARRGDDDDGKAAQDAVADAEADAAAPQGPTDFGARLEVCGKCEHAREFVSGFASFCDACGCNIQAKAFFEHLHCPIGKW